MIPFIVRILRRTPIPSSGAIWAGFFILALIGVAQCEHAKREDSDAAAAAYASDAALARARAIGWQARYANEENANRSLMKDLQHADSQSIELAKALKDAKATPVARTVATATSSGTINVEPTPGATATDTTVKDGPLTVAIHTEPAALIRLDWRLLVPLELVDAHMPNGRYAVFARSRDPRVTVAIDTFRYDPPKPPGTLLGKAKAFGVGAALGALGCALFCK